MEIGNIILYFAYAAIFLYIAIMLQIVIHEGGHLIFGLMSGYKFSSFRVGSFMLKKEDKKLVLKRFTLAGTGGQCIMAPPELVDGKMPYFWYNIGGALCNIVISVITAVLMVTTKDIKALSLFFLLMTVIGLFFGLTNGIPMNMGELDNDAMNIISLSKDKFAVKAMWIQLKLNDYACKNINLKDAPSELFELPENANMKNALIASVAVYKCNRLMAERKFDETVEKINKLLSSDANVPGIYRVLLNMDRAYCEMIGENRRELTDKYIGKTEKDVMNAMKNMPQIIRFQYTYSLFVESDVKKAEEYRLQMETVKKHYPYTADVEDEIDLINIAEGKYKHKKTENIN